MAYSHVGFACAMGSACDRPAGLWQKYLLSSHVPGFKLNGKVKRPKLSPFGLANTSRTCVWACRKTVIVNLDPANEAVFEGIKVNMADLISVEDVMEAYNLGPNGGQTD